ncbi:hypothetical protein [Roseibium algae]|uniref:Uncharacterized protein n=1 Tax=Roseibium algae TaxID=3123038 RepID=A0ABU8TMS6_9HYPH
MSSGKLDKIMKSELKDQFTAYAAKCEKGLRQSLLWAYSSQYYKGGFYPDFITQHARFEAELERIRKPFLKALENARKANPHLTDTPHEKEYLEKIYQQIALTLKEYIKADTEKKFLPKFLESISGNKKADKKTKPLDVSSLAKAGLDVKKGSHEWTVCEVMVQHILDGDDNKAQALFPKLQKFKTLEKALKKVRFNDLLKAFKKAGIIPA